MNDLSVEAGRAEPRSSWDRGATWVFGYFMPWVVILGGAWCIYRLGAPLHWWPRGETDSAIGESLMRSFITPLGLLGITAFPIAAWRIFRQSRN